MSTIGIVGLIVDHRMDFAPKVQEVLTDFGSIIRNRTGVPSSEGGIITLICEGEKNRIDEFTKALDEVDGVSVNHMYMDCPSSVCSK